MTGKLDRRIFLIGAAGAALAGCDTLTQSRSADKLYDASSDATNKAISALQGHSTDLTYGQARELKSFALAEQYPESAITSFFKPNGSIDPKDPAYKKLAEEKFVGFSMPVGGLVDAPRSFTLADLRALPARTQVTRHDCVEGWSCIGKWGGVPLHEVLNIVKPKDEARYVLFRCFDSEDTDTTTQPVDLSMIAGKPTPFYGTIGMADAVHPQTILAYDFNGEALPVAHGAPLRIRVERQLGYKMTKYIKSIELVSSFTDIGDGRGGYWEDQGYQWYAGI